MRNYFVIFFIMGFGLFYSQNTIGPKYIYEKNLRDVQLKNSDDLNFFYLKHIQYVGYFKEEIKISYQDLNLASYNPMLGNNYKKPNDSLNKEFSKHKYHNIKILVDIQQITPLVKKETDFSKITEDELVTEIDRMNQGEKPTKEIPEKEIYYEGFPVTIYNLDGEKEKIIGFGNHIPLELEALNKENKWKQLYGFRKLTCGTGVKYIILKPKQIATVFEPKLHGNFKTKFRYRLGNIISNEFEGSINESHLREKEN